MLDLLAPSWVLLLALAVSTGASAQPTAPKAAAAPAVPAKTVVAQASAGPGWAELSPAQRDILKPLAPNWASLSQTHKRKWLQMAKSYPALPTDEQAKMQGRMQEWGALSSQQRTQARLNFAKTKELSKELTPEEKKAKWEAYQSLSDDEKHKLAAKAPAKPLGAAPALKPVARQKLATIPSATDKPKVPAAPKIAVSQSIDSPPGTAPAAAAAPGVTPAQPH
ncbi:DUF3106 domain-containing protein [Polaromonas sp. SM01]|uniref:DUF3106 domain-containing protein n=1 Tax=Polaromonas sp. SM01 TaxID=3085630 RepID=UPI002981E449|nr:DUF3106 domain-containing protein [Polaromonas sp. SM01]MDW5444247.1 DUF3106 domain-containing protein [Polaromonas sp. SM01]